MTSLLWVSTDDGRSWQDAGGRVRGLHNTFVPLEDGSILGLGRQAPVDGYLPQSISRDGGKSWEVSKSPFPTVRWNQRPTILRLQSGRILFASDFQDIQGNRPEGTSEWGSFVAVSEDEGQSWIIKKLPGAQPHDYSGLPHGTLGYAVAKQAPNGVIHLITTMNRPSLHLAFNEAWVLEGTSALDESEILRPKFSEIEDRRRFQETFPDGSLKAVRSGGQADDGRFLLDGQETWYYSNGVRQYQVEYHLGRRVGKESYWTPDGSLKWEWEHQDDGSSVLTRYWSNGNKRSSTEWKNFHAEGPAFRWDRNGRRIATHHFRNGRLVLAEGE